MSKTPSLFDDFFSEDEEKDEEELFPDLPHVYNVEENKENIAKEEAMKEEEDEEEERNEEKEILKEEIKEELIEDESEEEKKEKDFSNSESVTTDESKESEEEIQKNPFAFKRPSLELPSEQGLDEQINQEIILTDATSFLEKKSSFDFSSIERVEEKKKKAEIPEAASVDPEPVEEDKSHKEESKSAQQSAESPQKKEVPEEDAEQEEVSILPEWTLNKNYYTIGEVAKMFEVNISHIRFWTNEFKLKPRTTRKGDRLFSPAEIQELRLIHYLVKVKKHTIKGAREKLKNQKETVNNHLALKESLSQLRDLLAGIREKL